MTYIPMTNTVHMETEKPNIFKANRNLAYMLGIRPGKSLSFHNPEALIPADIYAGY